MQSKTKQQGFTFIELLFAITLFSILATLAFASFEPALERSRERATASDLRRALNVARNHAVTKSVNTVMCASADGQTCLTAQPNNGRWPGWIVFEDGVSENGNALTANQVNQVDRSPDDGESEVVLLSASVNADRIAVIDSNDELNYVFAATGFVNSATTFSIEAPNPVNDTFYEVVVTLTGVPSLSQKTVTP